MSWGYLIEQRIRRIVRRQRGHSSGSTSSTRSIKRAQPMSCTRGRSGRSDVVVLPVAGRSSCASSSRAGGSGTTAARSGAAGASTPC